MKKILFYASAVAVMLSSCSKDTTEVAAPSLDGKQVFTASIAVNDESATRLHFGDNQTTYVWDKADAIGYGTSEQFVNFPAVTEGGTKPGFTVTSGDERYFEENWGGELLAYYPYNPSPEIGDGKVKLAISGTQNYAKNTFFRTTVPAVGYVEKYNGPETEIKMTVPVSMIRVKVQGWGETKALTLAIKNKDDNYYNLVGDCFVPMAAPVREEVAGKSVVTSPALTVDQSNLGSDLNDTNTITVTFGKDSESFEYDPTEPLYVYFVVPAGLDLNGATVEIYNAAKDDITSATDCEKYEYKGKEVADYDESRKTFANAVRQINTKPFNFGMDGKFVIEDENETAAEKWNDGYSAEEKFIAYAYLAQHQDAQNNVYPKTDDWKFIAEYLGYDIDWETLGANVVNDPDYQALTTTIAWIKSGKNDGILDFTDYGKQWAIDQKTALNTHLVQGGQDANPSAENNFWLNVYDWYIANEGIESLSYNAIVGDDDINPIVIKGLKVKGSGLIAKSGSAVDVYGNGAKLKNLKFVNCTVKGSSFLAADSQSLASNFENVVLGVDPEGKDNLVEYTGANYAGALFAVARPNIAGLISEGGVVIEKLPTVEAPSAVKGQVAGLFAASQPIAFDLTDYNVTSLAEPVFGEINKDCLVTVDTADAAPAAATAPYAGFVGRVQTGATASIIVDDTAYWNGTTATSNDGVAPLTAEELAYVLASSDNATIELALNYDMQGGELDLENYPQNPYPKVISGAKTISNLTVNTHNKTYHASLFGKTANLTDLTLKNITVNVVKQVSGKYTSVAGLAQTGTATNVTVDGLTVNLADGVAVNNDIIGGLFSAVAPANLNNVTANKVTLNALESIKTAGIVAGKLNLDANEDNAWTLSGITVSGAMFTGFNTDTVSSKDGDMKTVAGFVNTYGHAANYGGKNHKQVPFGYISVNDPKWGIAGNPVVQTLNGVNCNYYRIAARIFVGSDITSDTASVALDSNVSDIHAYQFHMDDVVNGTGYSLTKVGFVNDSTN